MNQAQTIGIPVSYEKLVARCEAIGFTMPSDIYIGTLLKSLIASKPAGHFLELGTGMSLSLAWMIAGMDTASRLTSIDNDDNLIAIANEFFGADHRVNLVCDDGANFIQQYNGPLFDLIFADAWPGKYSDLEKTLELITVGGFYVIDDMNPQPNWPEGHQQKAERLVSYLETRADFTLTKMDWSTGVIICVRRS